jgi:hypothetical protein
MNTSGPEADGLMNAAMPKQRRRGGGGAAEGVV